MWRWFRFSGRCPSTSPTNGATGARRSGGRSSKAKDLRLTLANYDDPSGVPMAELHHLSPQARRLTPVHDHFTISVVLADQLAVHGAVTRDAHLLSHSRELIATSRVLGDPAVGLGQLTSGHRLAFVVLWRCDAIGEV